MASNHGNSHSFMSQSVMTMSSGPDGRPQVYQETMSTRMAPGGIKETKKTVSDSRTGTRRMAIGHHIGERAHILERERNMHGDEEERQEFINLEEGNFSCDLKYNENLIVDTERKMLFASVCNCLYFIIHIVEEAESFDREWVSHIRRVGAIDGANSANASNVRVTPDPRQLALPSTTDLSARLVS